jgi:hypothetical protein
MSYREHDAHVRSEICGVPSHVRTHLLNGLSTEIVIPCNYVTTDEAGVEVLTPIHLTEEGYTDPVVVFAADAPSGLTGQAWIDADDDSLIHCIFDAQCPDALTVDIECEVSILISRETDRGTKTDSVLRGPVHIESAPIPSGSGV